ncbi:7694_t:CDS:1, partial [Gigaspora margarita]
RSKTMKEPKMVVSDRNICKDYCEVMGLVALLAEIDALISCLVGLAYFFSEYVDFLATVLREHLEYNFMKLSKDYRVKRICKALVKEYKKIKTKVAYDLLIFSA